VDFGGRAEFFFAAGFAVGFVGFAILVVFLDVGWLRGLFVFFGTAVSFAFFVVFDPPLVGSFFGGCFCARVVFGEAFGTDLRDFAGLSVFCSTVTASAAVTTNGLSVWGSSETLISTAVSVTALSEKGDAASVNRASVGLMAPFDMLNSLDLWWSLELSRVHDVVSVYRERLRNLSFSTRAFTFVHHHEGGVTEKRVANENRIPLGAVAHQPGLLVHQLLYDQTDPHPRFEKVLVVSLFEHRQFL